MTTSIIIAHEESPPVNLYVLLLVLSLAFRFFVGKEDKETPRESSKKWDIEVNGRGVSFQEETRP